jgi:hypothetical protein
VKGSAEELPCTSQTQRQNEVWFSREVCEIVVEMQDVIQKALDGKPLHDASLNVEIQKEQN